MARTARTANTTRYSYHAKAELIVTEWSRGEMQLEVAVFSAFTQEWVHAGAAYRRAGGTFSGLTLNVSEVEAAALPHLAAALQQAAQLMGA